VGRSSASGRSPRQQATGTRKEGFAISRDLRINQMIRVFDVRVVDEAVASLASMRYNRRLEACAGRRGSTWWSRTAGQSPRGATPRFRSVQVRTDQAREGSQAPTESVTFKEVRLKPKIGAATSIPRSGGPIEFLEEGEPSKGFRPVRGREVTHPQIGRDLLDKFAEQDQRTWGSSGFRCSRQVMHISVIGPQA